MRHAVRTHVLRPRSLQRAAAQDPFFADAFAKAVPLIRQREVEAAKSDGFSKPQVRVGKEIAPVLQRLEQRLEAEAAVAAAAGGGQR